MWVCLVRDCTSVIMNDPVQFMDQEEHFFLFSREFALQLLPTVALTTRDIQCEDSKQLCAHGCDVCGIWKKILTLG